MWPIVNHPEQELCNASQALLGDHDRQFHMARIIMQVLAAAAVVVRPHTLTFLLFAVSDAIYCLRLSVVFKSNFDARTV